MARWGWGVVLYIWEEALQAFLERMDWDRIQVFDLVWSGKTVRKCYATAGREHDTTTHSFQIWHWYIGRRGYGGVIDSKKEIKGHKKNEKTYPYIHTCIHKLPLFCLLRQLITHAEMRIIYICVNE